MENDERYYFELAYGNSLWGFEACAGFEVDEGRRMVCSVALAKEAGYGKDDLKIREALEKQLRADMKQRAELESARIESGWLDSPEGMTEVPPERRRKYAIEGLGYAQLQQIEGEPEHWRKTLDKLI